MLRCACLFLIPVVCFSLAACSNEPPTGSTVAAREAATGREVSHAARHPRWSSDSTKSIELSAISGDESSSDWVAIEELDAVLDRDRISVRSVPSRGPAEDLLDLLHSRKVDFGIVQLDAFEALEGPLQAAARERLRYIFRAPNTDMHILASSSIGAVRQLDGRKVNIGPDGSSSNLTARQVFKKLAIAPELTTFDEPTALRLLRSGDIDAAIILAARPSESIRAFQSDGMFHLVAVPFEEAVPDYLPGQLTSDDYPNLIQKGQTVDNLAVPRVLAVRNWPKGSIQYSRLARFTKAFYSRFSELQHPGHFAHWNETNLSSGAPGWKRFEPARNLLDSVTPAAGDQLSFRTLAVASGICSRPHQGFDCETFYNDFVAWRKARLLSPQVP
jgi:uncharacterized protein